MCRPSYEHHSDVTFKHSSFHPTSHQKEGESQLLFSPLSLRLVVNSNTPHPPPMFRQPTLHSCCMYRRLNYLHFINRKILLYYRPSLLVMKQCQSFTSQQVSDEVSPLIPPLGNTSPQSVPCLFYHVALTTVQLKISSQRSGQGASAVHSRDDGCGQLLFLNPIICFVLWVSLYSLSLRVCASICFLIPFFPSVSLHTYFLFLFFQLLYRRVPLTVCILSITDPAPLKLNWKS